MGPVPYDKLYKVRSLIYLIQKMRRFFKPYQKLVIDESLVLFRGRLSFIQYIPCKRHRFSLKFFVLCDCKTEYILDFVIYTGTDVHIPEAGPHGFSGAVVTTLLDKHFKSRGTTSCTPIITILHLHSLSSCCGKKQAPVALSELAGKTGQHSRPRRGDKSRKKSQDQCWPCSRWTDYLLICSRRCTQVTCRTVAKLIATLVSQ